MSNDPCPLTAAERSEEDSSSSVFLVSNEVLFVGGKQKTQRVTCRLCCAGPMSFYEFFILHTPSHRHVCKMHRCSKAYIPNTTTTDNTTTTTNRSNTVPTVVSLTSPTTRIVEQMEAESPTQQSSPETAAPSTLMYATAGASGTNFEMEKQKCAELLLRIENLAIKQRRWQVTHLLFHHLVAASKNGTSGNGDDAGADGLYLTKAMKLLEEYETENDQSDVSSNEDSSFDFEHVSLTGILDGVDLNLP